jgi:hypothetical protein
MPKILRNYKNQRASSGPASGGHSLLDVTDPAPSTNSPLPVENTAAITGVYGSTRGRIPRPTRSAPMAKRRSLRSPTTSTFRGAATTGRRRTALLHRPSRRRLRCTTRPPTVCCRYRFLRIMSALATGFSNWTLQTCCRRIPRSRLETTRLCSGLTFRLTILNKTNGTVLTTGLLGCNSYVSANQVWAGLGAGSVWATKMFPPDFCFQPAIARLCILLGEFCNESRDHHFHECHGIICGRPPHEIRSDSKSIFDHICG